MYSTANEIRSRILELCTLFGFEYQGHYFNIDPFSLNDFHVMCDEGEIDLQSIDDVMNRKMFCGKSLSEIAGEIEITEW